MRTGNFFGGPVWEYVSFGLYSVPLAQLEGKSKMTKKSGFQLKGSAAEIYEICWVPSLMGKCADDLVAAANIKPGDRVLDVACGTGVVARSAIQKCLPGGVVVGTDINEPMLAAARKIADDLGVIGVEWRPSDALDMPFEDASFDVVVCQQGLQFMPEKSKAIGEMARVLCREGRLAVSVWKEASVFGEVLSEVLDKHFGAGITAPWQVAYSFGDRDELRTLARECGFENIYVELDVKMGRHAVPKDFVAGAIAGSPLGAEFEQTDPDKRREIIEEIIRGIDKYMDDGGFAIPANCHTLTATKAS